MIDGAVISSVNFAEILAEHAPKQPPDVSSIFSLLSSIEPFTASQAQVAADLRSSTRSAGLSLGDRACLALAVELQAEVYTADRAWASTDLPCRVHLIR